MSRTKQHGRDRTVPAPAFEVRGAVPKGMVEMAGAKLSAALRHAPEPVLFARLKLSMAADPAVERPAMAQANLDVNGRSVRAHAAAPSIREAIDLMHDRVLARLERIERHWEAIRGGRPKSGPHEWRHDAEPSHRPDYYPRPIGEREITRHKTFAPATQTPDEAAFDMDVMDYDFQLFTDASTGRDSILYRTSDGYRLNQVGPGTEVRGPVAVPLSVSPHPAVRLSVKQAIERLELAGLPFVFFADETTGRGNVLYHRYDGHYGLITPAA